MNKIVAITVNYSREESTKNLLKTLDLSNNDGFILEIIVVDNGPKSNFKLTEKYITNVTVIAPGTNTGFAGGNNLGIKQALKKNANFIVLINDDTIVDKNMIKNLYDVMQSDKKIGIASPKIYFAKGHEFHVDRYGEEDLGKVIWFAGGYNDWKHAKSVHRGVDEVDVGQYNTVEKIDFATGCCMIIRTEVVNKVGLFDEKYFLYYEDGDLDMRVKKAGYDITYVPSAIIYHENASSSGGAGNKLHDYFLTRNQMLFGMKYAPLRTKISLIRQSFRLLVSGRKEQRLGIKDYYLRRFGKGSYIE